MIALLAFGHPPISKFRNGGRGRKMRPTLVSKFRNGGEEKRESQPYISKSEMGERKNSMAHCTILAIDRF
jgi:hypothetical protein